MLPRSVQYDLLHGEARRHGPRPLIRYFIWTVARLARTSVWKNAPKNAPKTAAKY